MQGCTVAWRRDCILYQICKMGDDCLVEPLVVHLLFVVRVQCEYICHKRQNLWAVVL